MLPQTDTLLALGLLAVSLLVALRWLRPRPGRMLVAALAGLACGLINASLLAQGRLDDALADQHHDEVSRLDIRVAEMSQRDATQRRFVGEVLKGSAEGIPSRVLVTWRALPGDAVGIPELIPGQVWRMALVLRRPQAVLNPHGPDAQARMFAKGLRATGTLRGTPRLLRDEPWGSTGVVIERARHHVRAGMRVALKEARYAPVLIALAVGDQAGVAREDWQIFNRSGITHLVSISGMHVTLIAGMGAMLVAGIWRRARWRGVGLAEFFPARLAGATAAFFVALAYCLLAGWGVPARRTFFMLAVALGAALLRLPVSSFRVLACAAAVVALLDPWAAVSPGFWLSFAAVAILLRASSSVPGTKATGWRRVQAWLAQFGYLQMAVTVGLTPLLAFLVHQVSLGSPLANAVAIPMVSFVVTPLALLCAALSVLPGAAALAQAVGWLGHQAFFWTMVPVVWVGQAAWSSVSVAAAPMPWLLLAIVGMVWALQVRGWPARHLGWMCVLPLLFWRPDKPEPGFWRAYALDVGQGSAIVVETASQVLLFDSGPRQHNGTDAGERIVVPFLRAHGVRGLDVLVLSHADLDHVGGTRAVLSALPVSRSFGSFDLASHLEREARLWPGDLSAMRLPQDMRACRQGQGWEVDEVRFVFLHPDGASTRRADKNAMSCVLLVQGREHALLLPGDIGLAQERALTFMLPTVDVVLAPHHGAATSSSDELVQATTPAHVIAQAGALNRFGHPVRKIQSRWRRAGAAFWRTDEHGAIVVSAGSQGLSVWAQREQARRYWHGR